MSSQPTGPYKFANVYSGMLIGVQGASTEQGAPLVQWPDNGSPDQQWMLLPIMGRDRDPAFIIENVNSRLVISVQEQEWWLAQLPYSGSRGQQWQVAEVAGRDVIFVSETNGQLLSVQGQSKEAGANLVLSRNEDNIYQQWAMSKA